MTPKYYLWQQALDNSHRGMYSLMMLAVLFVGSYLMTYVPWIPNKYGKALRIGYEVGGVFLYAGMLVVSSL
jgi:hypothetical protein